MKVLGCLYDLPKLFPVCPDIRSTVEDLTEVFKIAAFIHKVGFVDHQREALKPDLPVEFKRLAGCNLPPCPTSLFGDNLEQSVKSISEFSLPVRKSELLF